MQEIGEIFQYYGKIGVAAIRLNKSLKAGDKIKIRGNTTDFEQEVKSIQIEHTKVKEAKKGDEIGVKVDDKVRRGDK
ncbi:MAG: EF-Tu/IF-2/RF-3 family GTPase, partial [Nanoarchaeota archaeon]